jgi:YHS domain-containing protein
MLDITGRPSVASHNLIENDQPLCEHCHKPFEARSGSGGKPQRFCSPECRTAFHNDPQRSQRSPTCSASTTLPAVIPPEPKDAPQATPDDYCWVVPFQPRIECSRTNDDEVEIEQLSPFHPDENVRIHVARSNAVRLARCILWATGFKGVLIASTDGGGGYSDVEDGGLPEHFDRGAR